MSEGLIAESPRRLGDAVGGQRVDGTTRLGEEGRAEAAAVFGIELRLFDQDSEQVERSVPLRIRGPRDAGGEPRSDAGPAEKHRSAFCRQFPAGEEVVDAVKLVEAGLQKVGFGHDRVRDGGGAVGGECGAHRGMACPVVEDGEIAGQPDCDEATARQSRVVGGGGGGRGRGMYSFPRRARSG